MELSLERKVYGAVLLLAIGGLAADRLFLQSGLTGPNGARAAVPEDEPGVPVIQRTAAELKSPLASLSQKLESFRTAIDSAQADGFALPDALLKQISAAAPAAEPAEPAPALASREADDLVLRAVTGVGSPNAIAQINGEAVSFGAPSKSGLTLVSLTQEPRTDPMKGETFVAVVRDAEGRESTLRMTVGGLADSVKRAPKR